MSAHPNKGEFWQGAPKPKADAPKTSWWIGAAQTSREEFRKRLEAEAPRFNAHPQFGGFRRVHDSGLES